jgi:tetratricopeptide (TPR) repeat protein
MRIRQQWPFALLVLLLASAALAAQLTRAQALAALTQADAGARLAAVDRLGDIGSMIDASRVLERLGDADPQVRSSAAAAVWQIWSRSGDSEIDKLYASGVEQMQASALGAALATFSEIIRRKPAFAEGWNKRATIYFLLGEDEKSLRDCEEVFKRNPSHFGALAGAGQIYLKLGNARLALEFFRRAVKVNPNLVGPTQMIPLLERKLQDDDKNRT